MLLIRSHHRLPYKSGDFHEEQQQGVPQSSYCKKETVNYSTKTKIFLHQ
jgi:hypothetical protein